MISGKALIVLVVAALVGGAYLAKLGPFSPSLPQQTVCTMETKICPNGSSVGRTGPSCEFATCPADETANWKIYKSSEDSYQFKYPLDWSYQVSNQQHMEGVVTVVVIGPLVTINHIGDTVTPYPAPVVTLTIKTAKDSLTEVVNPYRGMSNSEVSEIDLMNIKAYKVLHMGCVSGNCMSIFFMKGDKLYEFSGEQGESKVESIVNTFKFL